MKRDDPKKLINSYKRKQQMLPFIIWGLALLLVIVGIIILVIWLVKPGQSSFSLFASATPTETATMTPTEIPPTATFTITPTVTETSTITVTPTRSGPIEYTINEGDTCFDIAATFEVNLMVLLAINNFDPGTCPLRPGDTIIIPAPNQELPTATPWPSDLPRGTRLTYVVQFGDSLDVIADNFLSTIEDIMEINNLENSNQIFAGQVLEVRVNLVTPLPTMPATVTPTP
ncbi:MAG TPA: LysM peptidoglycan-binding domain-containing protein [Anaerolineaceae bacterium]|nr:LysM peptidoglycan-binding domain-containing protein [Anaerolineaceae bacterium]